MPVLFARAAAALEASHRMKALTTVRIAASREQKTLRALWQQSADLRLRAELAAFRAEEIDENVLRALAVAMALRNETVAMLRSCGGGEDSAVPAAGTAAS